MSNKATPAEPVDDNGYSIYRVGDGGARGQRIAQDLTANEAMSFLSSGFGFPGVYSEQFEAVQQYDGKTVTVKLGDPTTTASPAAIAVVEAWTAGTRNAAAGRQLWLGRQWPVLADSLNLLTQEVKRAEG